mmetsp:Transcript_1925/g.4555  ORF Transcript_1925/g.4555 Transcript_1925/m.4555 type:complete len:104 (+) Transcript_1925:25-336(+)
MSETKGLRVNRYFPKVKDFERDEKGNVLGRSLKGPAFMEAHEQFCRERFVAVEEAKILREQVSECYRREGVNHLENCKDLVSEYVSKISSPYYGMLKGPTRLS